MKKKVYLVYNSGGPRAYVKIASDEGPIVHDT